MLVPLCLHTQLHCSIYSTLRGWLSALIMRKEYTLPSLGESQLVKPLENICELCESLITLRHCLATLHISPLPVSV